MMEIVSFCVLPLLSLLIAACFCQSYGLSTINATGRCEPRDCSQLPRSNGGVPFPCVIGAKKACEGFDLKPSGRGAQNVIPPGIVGVNVYQRLYPDLDNKSHPVLNVTLGLPGDAYSLNRTKAVKLSVESVDQSQYKYCRLFDFRNATFTKQDVAEPRMLFYPCFCGLADAPTGTYMLTVASLPDNVKVEYFATVPVHPGKWRSSLVLWQPIGKLELKVMFQRHPDVHQYNLTLYSYSKSGTFCRQPGKARIAKVKTVKDGSNTVTFKANDDRKYFVMVVPLNCDSCESTSTYCLALKGEEEPGVPGREPPGETASPPGIPDTPVITHVGSQQNDKATKTILGVVCGVVAGALLVVFLTYLYSRKGKCVCPFWQRGLELPVPKEEPTVLILYSSDCAKHKSVVERLAYLLMQTFDCHIHFDLFELLLIQQKGLLSWLQEKIDASDYIIFVCSTGGRLQCSNRRMQLNEDHPVEKYFCTAVEEVTNIWREWKIKKENIAVITMGYSTRGDIPPKLDSFRKFPIRDRHDLVPLFCYLRHTDKMPQELHLSEDLELFIRALQDATTFFQENPGWINNLLDKNYPDSKTPATAKRGKKSAVGSRLRNETVEPPQYMGDNGWYYPVENKISRCYSQPNSILSSDGSYRYNAMSSRSLVCLNKNSMGEEIELDTVHASLLAGSRPRNKGCLDSEDSDIEDTSPKSMSMPVDIHRTATLQDSSSDSRGTHGFTSDSDESDIAKTIQYVHKGPDSEAIRKIVHPSYNGRTVEPVPPWLPSPIVNPVNSFSMLSYSPRDSNVSDHCVTMSLETSMSADC